MRLTRFLLVPVVAAAMLAAMPESVVRASCDPLPLVPRPVSAERLDIELTLQPGARVVLPEGAAKAFHKSAEIFADKVRLRHDLEIEVVSGLANERACEGSILVNEVVEECGLANMLPRGEAPGDEGYKLHAGESMLISARTAHGFHNALMTLMQLIHSSGSHVKVCAASIRDYPRFAWRGMLLDTARSFLPADVMKRYIDILSELKVSRLHWHLVDDQGWRIESKAFPRLHQKGGITSNLSSKKLEAIRDVKFDKNGKRVPRGRFERLSEARDMRGYYTREELEDIVTYAADRQVMIVPEIDVPGHSSAMLAAYPELSCSGKKTPVRQGPGIYPTALCPSKEEVYDFLDTLFAELSGIFPSPYVHIGSDEVLAIDWLNHPGNRELMQAHGYTDKHGLQSYFVERVNEILQHHGKTMIGWDEITGYAPEGSMVQAWRKHGFAAQAARAGHDSVVSPVTHCYIDYPQLAFTLKNLYLFEPIPERLEQEYHHRILGGEVNLWGERVTLENIDEKAFPRVLAHAEVTWSKKDDRDWKDFVKRLGKVKKDMEQRGVGFGATWRDIIMPF